MGGTKGANIDREKLLVLVNATTNAPGGSVLSPILLSMLKISIQIYQVER